MFGFGKKQEEDTSLVYLTPEKDETLEQWSERVFARIPTDHSDDDDWSEGKEQEEPRRKFFGLF